MCGLPIMVIKFVYAIVSTYTLGSFTYEASSVLASVPGRGHDATLGGFGVSGSPFEIKG